MAVHHTIPFTLYTRQIKRAVDEKFTSKWVLQPWYFIEKMLIRFLCSWWVWIIHVLAVKFWLPLKWKHVKLKIKFDFTFVVHGEMKISISDWVYMLETFYFHIFSSICLENRFFDLSYVHNFKSNSKSTIGYCSSVQQNKTFRFISLHFSFFLLLCYDDV